MSADTTFESNVNTNDNDHNHSLTINYILLSDCKMAHCLVFIICYHHLFVLGGISVGRSEGCFGANCWIRWEIVVAPGGDKSHGSLGHHTIQYHTIPYNTIPYNAIQCHAMSYCIIPYHTKPNNTKKQPHHTDTSPHHTISGDKSHGSPRSLLSASHDPAATAQDPRLQGLAETIY